MSETWAEKFVLDVCCGPKKFWFDKADPRVLFLDCRREAVEVTDAGAPEGKRVLVIDPDRVASFADLPLPDNHFYHVVMDPPHLERAGSSGWLAKTYGKLNAQWKSEIADGFRECFRVLRPGGTLLFKWNETDVALREVLALSPVRPLYGQKLPKSAGTFWVVFVKGVEA